MQEVAVWLDTGGGGSMYRDAVSDCQQKPVLSQQVLDEVQAHPEGFFQWAMEKSLAHGEQLLTETQDISDLQAQATQSLQQATTREADEDMPLDRYIEDYFSRLHAKAEALGIEVVDSHHC